MFDRPDLVLVDGRLVPSQEATVSAFDRAVLYGESLFETIKVVEGAPCFWPEHRRRLAAGCDELGIPLDGEFLDHGIRRLLEWRRPDFGVLRVQVTGGVQPGGGRGMTAPSEGRRPRVVASVRESEPPSDVAYTKGVAVVTGGDLARPLPWLKSGSYLASVAAKGMAESLGAFECLFVGGMPRGLLEGSFSNVVLWDGIRLVTPSERLVLPGVTLGVVLGEARRLGMEVGEGVLSLEQVWGRSLFLTGSLLGICPCSWLDGRALAPLVELADTLRSALREREALSRKAWRES